VSDVSGPLLLKLTRISEPFDAGRVVELKFDVQGPYEVRGELYIRVPANERHEWMPGDTFGTRLKRL
jgi:hypothetical protein